MTLAAGIEIAVDGTPARGSGKQAGAMPGTGRAGMASQALLPSMAPGAAAGTVAEAKSFREGWQSLLASLDSSAGGLSGAEPETGRGTSLAGSAAAAKPGAREAAIRPSAATPALARGGALSLRQGAEKKSNEAGVEAKLSAACARNEASLARLADGVSKTAFLNRRIAAGRIDEKKSAAGRKSESERKAQPAHSSHEVKLEAAVPEAMPGLLPSASATLSMTVPAPVIVPPAAQGTNFKAHAAPPDLSSAKPVRRQPAEIASASLIPHLPNLPHPPAQNRSSAVTAAERASVQETADGDETPARQERLMPLPSVGEPSGPALNRIELPSAPEDAEPAGAMRAASLNLSETPAAPARNPAQTVARSQDSPQSAVPIQIPAETTAPGLTLASAPSRDSSQTLQQNQADPSTQPVKQVDQSAPALIGNAIPDRLAAFAGTAAAPFIQPLPEVAAAGAPDTAVSGKSRESGSLRPARGAGKAGLAEQDAHSVEGQPSSPAMDAFAMARDGAGLRGAVRGTGEPAGAFTVSPASSEPRETFAALDAGDAVAKPAWIHAGTQRAEAGFQDPALGWVGVRADTSGGGVHAQLVPGSADAAQALSGHLAGLNAYLAEHHTPVETLTLAAPESGWAGGQSGTGGGQQMQQGAGQQTAQGRRFRLTIQPTRECTGSASGHLRSLRHFTGGWTGVRRRQGRGASTFR